MKVILAVSGGVDSMTLLHALNTPKSKVIKYFPKYQLPITNYKIVIAHFDHGIRENSHLDADLVMQAAKNYKLPFELGTGNLGPKASEAVARKARHEFFETVQKKHNAEYIVTAHHQDDELETVIINMLRGTGRRGLSSLRSNKNFLRPLIDTPKPNILKYAHENNIIWREDETNYDQTYLRNYVRANIMINVQSNTSERSKLLELLNDSHISGALIDKNLDVLYKILVRNGLLDKKAFTMLPHSVSLELMMFWLRDNGVKEFDRRLIERLVVAVKTAKVGSKHNITGELLLYVKKNNIHMGLKI